VQFDSQAWFLILFNIAFLFVFSWAGLKLLKNGSRPVKLADIYLASCQMTPTSPERLQVKKYLVIRRLIKTESDDDPPYLAS
jgi:hypothetical protein